MKNYVMKSKTITTSLETTMYYPKGSTVEVYAFKSNDLSLIPETHMEEWENQLLHVVL